jgi:hypothetical protein
MALTEIEQQPGPPEDQQRTRDSQHDHRAHQTPRAAGSTIGSPRIPTSGGASVPAPPDATSSGPSRPSTSASRSGYCGARL